LPENLHFDAGAERRTADCPVLAPEKPQNGQSGGARCGVFLAAPRRKPAFAGAPATPRRFRVRLLPFKGAELHPTAELEDVMAKDERTNTEKGVDKNVRGKGNQLKGRVKDAVGGLTNDSSLQAEGKFDKVKGKVQDKVGDVQRRVGRETDRPKDEPRR
jgi:uncharacterized protein YjbJ (UPF0337 family)